MDHMPLRKLFSTIVLAVITPVLAMAQTAGLGSWNIVHVKYTPAGTWSAFGEAQVRSLGFYTHFHYHEYKAGVNYRIHPNVTLTLGAGKYDTYKEGGDFVLPKNADEFRLWPQVVLSQPIGKFKVEQRYRAEFRYTTNGNSNRFRYRLGLAYPFGAAKNGYTPFQISASNELFFTTTEPYFQRNRSLVAFSFRTSQAVTLQLGYLHQFDYRINDETGRDFLQIGIFVEFFSKLAAPATSTPELKDNQ